jgi:DNA primase
MLYNLNLAKDSARRKRNLLICEGYMDVISLFQNNIKSVVAPLGTAFTEEQLKISWRYADRPTIMFDGDEAGRRASFKAAIMCLPFLIPNKTIQFVTLPNNTDPDSYLENQKFNDLLILLKNPTKLLDFIFYTSSNQISLQDADQKISYDKYLDDLIETIKDKKTQYFYKREFKSLFFAKLRGDKNKTIAIIPKKITSLKKKQIYSFIASAINHKKIRSQVVEILLTNFELEKTEKEIVDQIDKNKVNALELTDFLLSFSENLRKFLNDNIIITSVYELFPYSAPKYDSDKALIEIKESTNNLNTRLSNLKKINKSLIRFEKNSSSLNWEELQKISAELEDDYEDN